MLKESTFSPNYKKTLSGNTNSIFHTAFFKNGSRVIISGVDKINLWEVD